MCIRTTLKLLQRALCFLLLSCIAGCGVGKQSTESKLQRFKHTGDGQDTSAYSSQVSDSRKILDRGSYSEKNTHLEASIDSDFSLSIAQEEIPRTDIDTFSTITPIWCCEDDAACDSQTENQELDTDATFEPYEDCGFRLKKMTRQQKRDFRKSFRRLMTVNPDAEVIPSLLSNGRWLFNINPCGYHFGQSDPFVAEGIGTQHFYLFDDERLVSHSELNVGLPAIGFVPFECTEAERNSPYRYDKHYCELFENGDDYVHRRISSISGHSIQNLFAVITLYDSAVPCEKGSVQRDSLYHFDGSSWHRLSLSPPNFLALHKQLDSIESGFPQDEAMPSTVLEYLQTYRDGVIVVRKIDNSWDSQNRGYRYDVIFRNREEEKVLFSTFRLRAISAFMSGEIVLITEDDRKLIIHRYVPEDNAFAFSAFHHILPFDTSKIGYEDFEEFFIFNIQSPDQISMSHNGRVIRKLKFDGNDWQRVCHGPEPEWDVSNNMDAVWFGEAIAHSIRNLAEYHPMGAYTDVTAGGQHFVSVVAAPPKGAAIRHFYGNLPTRRAIKIDTYCGYTDKNACLNSIDCGLFFSCTYKNGRCKKEQRMPSDQELEAYRKNSSKKAEQENHGKRTRRKQSGCE
ncbi:MAG: hypothetical protein JXX14_18225 [Deltaproteobacteria bacterium]|nr:hypothetical protein [Deltaproteobacteria bacterium]